MTDIKKVLNERGKIHGDFSEHARITQNLKAMVRNGLNWRETRLTSVQMEAIEMILHKIGRIIAGDPDHNDHWVDIAGYAQLAADRAGPGPVPVNKPPTSAFKTDGRMETDPETGLKVWTV